MQAELPTKVVLVSYISRRRGKNQPTNWMLSSRNLCPVKLPTNLPSCWFSQSVFGMEASRIHMQQSSASRRPFPGEVMKIHAINKGQPAGHYSVTFQATVGSEVVYEHTSIIPW